MMASRYAHAKQFKRHHRQLRLLRSRLGRIICDIRRKITGRPELEAVFECPPVNPHCSCAFASPETTAIIH
jgi:IS5 family transposase